MSGLVESKEQKSLIESRKYQGFLARYKSKMSQRLVHDEVMRFQRFVSEYFPGHSEPTQEMINLYQNYLLHTPINEDGDVIRNSTYARKISHIKKFFDYFGHTFEYNTVKVKPYHKNKKIGEKNLKAILGFLAEKKQEDGQKKVKYLRDHVLFWLYYLTGRRKSEILNLRVSDLKQKEGILHYETLGKGRNEIFKEYPKSLIEDTKNLIALTGKSGNDYLFTSVYTRSKCKMAHDSINKILKRYHQQMFPDQPVPTVHSIRHQSAWTLHNLGFDILKIKEHLDHAHLNTTHIYLSSLKAEKVEYYSHMEKALSSE